MLELLLVSTRSGFGSNPRATGNRITLPFAIGQTDPNSRSVPVLDNGNDGVSDEFLLTDAFLVSFSSWVLQISSQYWSCLHRNFSVLKNGEGIIGVANCGPAINRLMVTRCISNVAQLGQSLDIYKGATGVCIQADKSSNIGSERLDKNGRFRSPRAARELAL